MPFDWLVSVGHYMGHSNPLYIYYLYSYVQEVQHNINKLKQTHINAVGKKKITG